MATDETGATIPHALDFEDRNPRLMLIAYRDAEGKTRVVFRPWNLANADAVMDLVCAVLPEVRNWQNAVNAREAAALGERLLAEVEAEAAAAETITTPAGADEWDDLFRALTKRDLIDRTRTKE